MKKNIRIAAYYIAVAVFAAFTSCSGDNANSVVDSGGKNSEAITADEPNVDNVNVVVTDSAKYTIEEMADKVFGKEGANSDTQNLRQRFVDKAHEEEKQFQNESGANQGMLFYSYTFKYKSTDLKGNPIDLSAQVSWKSFAGYSFNPDNIILYEHYTIMKDAEAPSRTTNVIQTLVGNNLVIQPDYIGYGATRNELHPYLNHDITAINSVDALGAGFKVWKTETKNSKELSKNWKTYVIGASQGGSSALAVHKYLDTHLDIANKWHFGYSYCCCGPYCPTVTMEKYYKDGHVTFPGGILLTVKSMLASYPEILGKWTEDDFYSEKFRKIKSTVDKMIASKEYKTTELNDKLRELLDVKKGDPFSLKDILSTSVLDMNSEIAQAFFKCLEKNDLTTGWTPVHEIRLYQTTVDDVVPYANAERLRQAFPDKVKEEMIWDNLSHVSACTHWTMFSLWNRTW